jgi:hypothetical protein
MRWFKLFVVLAAFTAALTAAVQAGAGGSSRLAQSPYNLEVILRPTGGADGGFGHVKFREDEDAIVHLGVWLRGLAPDTGYYLERATDREVNDVCDGTNWLKLGQGNEAEVITTDDRGTARASLWRDVSAAGRGTEFDIHFRVAVAGTSPEVVVLESGCYQFTVR